MPLLTDLLDLVQEQNPPVGLRIPANVKTFISLKNKPVRFYSWRNFGVLCNKKTKLFDDCENIDIFISAHGKELVGSLYIKPQNINIYAPSGSSLDSRSIIYYANKSGSQNALASIHSGALKAHTVEAMEMMNSGGIKAFTGCQSPNFFKNNMLSQFEITKEAVAGFKTICAFDSNIGLLLIQNDNSDKKLELKDLMEIFTNNHKYIFKSIHFSFCRTTGDVDEYYKTYNIEKNDKFTHDATNNDYRLSQIMSEDDLPTSHYYTKLRKENLNLPRSWESIKELEIKQKRLEVEKNLIDVIARELYAQNNKSIFQLIFKNSTINKETILNTILVALDCNIEERGIFLTKDMIPTLLSGNLGSQLLYLAKSEGFKDTNEMLFELGFNVK
ncbi:putative adhesin [Francisella philomiragia]|uniref:putative adhesin n=1 Tax=Francisella philomiragia TaxID=28110 RepID=UPI0035131413